MFIKIGSGDPQILPRSLAPFPQLSAPPHSSQHAYVNIHTGLPTSLACTISPEACRKTLRDLPVDPRQLFGPAAQQTLERSVQAKLTDSSLQTWGEFHHLAYSTDSSLGAINCRVLSFQQAQWIVVGASLSI